MTPHTTDMTHSAAHDTAQVAAQDSAEDAAKDAARETAQRAAQVPVSVVASPDLAGKRLAFVLSEDRLGHYPEFREFLSRSFHLERIGLDHPGYVRAPSGQTYALVFVGRSGQPFPAGVEICAIVDALEPLDDDALDRDLWAILRWVVAGAGGDWRVEDLDRTGALYRIPAVATQA